MIKYILCWDIDGTLLTTGGGGIPAWENTVEEISGRKIALSTQLTAGRTDVEIAMLLAAELGDTSRTFVQNLITQYEHRLPDCLPSQPGYVLPGVITLLGRLQSMPWIYSLLLTGNTERGASVKLNYYGLSHFFQHGAFSDGLTDRPSIAKKAVEIVKANLILADNVEYFVIGDTPHDIHCGKAIGAKTVAVCTGRYNAESLSPFNPWVILDSLENNHDFFQKLNLLQ